MNVHIQAPRLLITCDGRSGAGKSQLAAALAAYVSEAGHSPAIIEVEDYCPGWTGLEQAVDRVGTFAQALAEGEHPWASTWDWTAENWNAASPVVPPDCDTVIIAGCGAGARAISAHADLNLWIEAPADVRRARVAARDPYDWSAYWETWAAQEDALLAAWDARANADFVLTNP